VKGLRIAEAKAGINWSKTLYDTQNLRDKSPALPRRGPRSVQDDCQCRAELTDRRGGHGL
jgi:hypothetical protein